MPSNKKKKGRRKNKKSTGPITTHKKDANAEDQPTTTVETSECDHGLTDCAHYHHRLTDEQREPLHLFFNDLIKDKLYEDDHPLGLLPFIECTFKAAREMGIKGILHDPALIPVGLNIATGMMLENEERYPEVVAIVRAIVHIEKGSIDYSDDGSRYDHATYRKLERKMNAWYQKFESKREVVEYLDHRIPCNCLADLKKQVLEDPESVKRECHHCEKLYTKLSNEEQRCERCRVAHYCSRECQLAAWKHEHKTWCDYFCNKTTIEQFKEHQCYHCRKATNEEAMRCSRCRVARYCSADCQQADWPLHQSECKKPPLEEFD